MKGSKDLHHRKDSSMKIGILTHHYVKNFGAFLQAVALIHVIQEIAPNACVEIIDYRVRRHEIMNSVHYFGFKPNRGDTFKGYLEKIGLYFTQNSFEKSLPKSNRVYSKDDINALQYDLIIVGSDEVWNFNDIAYDSIKFGSGINAPLISYSASVGGSSIEDGISSDIINGLSRFKAIAVRDQKSEELAKYIVGDKINVIRTLDPVFLYDYKLKIRDKIRRLTVKPYILIYDCHVTGEQAMKLVDFAQDNNMDIIGAGEYRKWYTKHTVNISPFEWVYLFMNSWGVVTGTFHGTSFAIKYNKPFVAYLTELNRVNKVGSLLSEVGLEKQLIKATDSIIDVMKQSIDYERVNKIIEARKVESIRFLQSNIKKIQSKEWNDENCM